MTRIRITAVKNLVSLLVAVAAVGCVHAPVASPVAEVTPADLRILARAQEILSSSARWNRHDTRECSPHAHHWSLFCALKQASLDVTGRYEHRRAALETVRSVIQERAGHDFPHRMMDYNNLSTTDFADIRAVLSLAVGRLESEVQYSVR